MTNELKYRFADFTTKHYRELIQEAKKKFTFSFFHEIDRKHPFLLWRHDIDFSPHRALRCAQIEHEEGVKATYFVHIHNEYYNFFEKEVTEIIKEIALLGHEIGIHFDIYYYDINNENELEKHLLFEKEILEKFLPIQVKAFSFHLTNDFIKTCNKEKYANLINVYSSYFQNEVKYCSDSNGYWRFERMMDVIKTEGVNQLQLLTHPEWWQEEIMSPFEKIKRCIINRADNNLKTYEELLKNFQAKNIDWANE